MSSINKTDSFSEFLKIFNRIDFSKNQYEKWADFIFLSAAALRNSVKNINPFFYSQEIENEYLKIIAKYSKDDQMNICKLFGLFVDISEKNEPIDILGYIFMDLGLTDSWKGQFFTPNAISQLMAKFHIESINETLSKQDYVSVSDPACGAGSTLLAIVNSLISKGIDPSKRLFVHAQDIDRTVALMCYIQLTLWNVPAVVVVGDSLKNEIRETWHTASYVMNSYRFKARTINKVTERNFILIGEPY